MHQKSSPTYGFNPVILFYDSHFFPFFYNWLRNFSSTIIQTLQTNKEHLNQADKCSGNKSWFYCVGQLIHWILAVSDYLNAKDLQQVLVLLTSTMSNVKMRLDIWMAPCQCGLRSFQTSFWWHSSSHLVLAVSQGLCAHTHAHMHVNQSLSGAAF